MCDLEKGIEAFNTGDYQKAIHVLYPLTYKPTYDGHVTREGNAQAQYYMGLMYYKGYGGRQSYGDAGGLFKKSAQKRHAEAQFYLGWMYEHGEGFRPDEMEALKWYRAAAEQGHAQAQHHLARFYALGGIAAFHQDLVRAHMWHNLAASNGYEKAANLRDFLATKMTPEKIAEAEEMAIECKANDYKGC
ncbi:MAG: sel1 repeat family protein [Proteobacteria bacterium]|nr:sel1 repeat family protein [Pseudomonadota bacterium]